MMESTETNETTALEQSTEIKEEVRQNESQDEQVTEQDTPVQQPAEEEEQPQEDAQQPQAAESETMPTTNIYKTKEEVVARAQQIVENGEASDKQELDLLKQLFYKFHNAEAQKAREEHFAEGGTEDTFMPPVDLQEPVFRTAMQVIRERRAALLQEQELQKKKNLERKLQILERIQQLAATPEEANQAFDEMKALQTEWKEIKAVPAEQATELWKNYQLYVEQFYDLLKLGHELRDYDFKKNLETKTRLYTGIQPVAETASGMEGDRSCGQGNTRRTLDTIQERFHRGQQAPSGTLRSYQAGRRGKLGQEDSHLRRTGKPADRQSEDLCRLGCCHTENHCPAGSMENHRLCSTEGQFTNLREIPQGMR